MAAIHPGHLLPGALQKEEEEEHSTNILSHIHLSITLSKKDKPATMRNFQTKRCWGLRSSGILRSMGWWLLTDVLEQLVISVLKDQEVQEKFSA